MGAQRAGFRGGFGRGGLAEGLLEDVGLQHGFGGFEGNGGGGVGVRIEKRWPWGRGGLAEARLRILVRGESTRANGERGRSGGRRSDCRWPRLLDFDPVGVCGWSEWVAALGLSAVALRRELGS